MYIDLLPTDTQNLVMVNFEFFGKAMLLLLAFAFSLFYAYYLRDNQKETPYFLVGLLRSVLYMISKIVIWIFPLCIFFMYPQVPMDTVLVLMLSFYTIGFFVFGIILFLNVVYVGPLLLMKAGGYNPYSKHTNAVLEKLMGKKLTKLMNNSVIRDYGREIRKSIIDANEYMFKEK